MKEIALMLDMGRKFYTKDWILNLIDHMHQLNMNTLQLHFSENEGFRIACDNYPQIVSEQHLTKAEVRDIIAHANRQGIQIIPDLDTPGHVKHLLTFFPQFQLSGDDRALDITNPQARAFIKTLYQEYAELFAESTYFHIGADEFIDFDKVGDYPALVNHAKTHYGPDASGLETYVDYTNDIATYVTSLGFIPRVWNDGFFRTNRHSLVTLTPHVEITYWTRWHPHMASAQTFIERGYQLINFCDNYFYYVLGEAAGYTYPTAHKIHKEWVPHRFAQAQYLTPEQMVSVKGSAFAIWSDRPEAQTEQEVFSGIQAPLQAMIQCIAQAT